MKFNYNSRDYEVVVVKKNNKNTYIRYKDGKIFVTTNYFTSTRYLKKLLQDSYVSIAKMIDKIENKKEADKQFKLFGKPYEIIYTGENEMKIENNVIYTKDEQTLKKWLDKKIKEIYAEHLESKFNIFEEDIPIPNLKIRKMKTRWGVCNIKNHNITLNYELYRYDIECLDYVIVHELSHFLEANHSKKFWKIVEKYCVDYKRIRKKLRG